MDLRRPLVGLLVPVLLATAVAGCAGTRADGGGGGTQPVATTSVDLPPSYRFAPADIEVASGSTVTWTNHDHFTHTVQLLDGGLPSTPMSMEPGATVSFAFTTPGTYHYQCSLHPQDMRGTVTVTG